MRGKWRAGLRQRCAKTKSNLKDSFVAWPSDESVLLSGDSSGRLKEFLVEVRRSGVAGQQYRFASVARAKGTRKFSPPKFLLKRTGQGLANEAKARSLSSDRFQRSDEQRGLAIAGRSAIEGRRSPQNLCAVPSSVAFLPES
jgi:hypothetical protein